MAATAGVAKSAMPARARRLSHLAVVLLAAVALARGVLVLRAATPLELLTGHGERTWFAWASPPGLDAATAFSGVEGQLQPGEPVLLVLPAGGLVRFWRVMAPYHLVRHEMLAVQSRPLPRIPFGTAIVALGRNGEMEVRRAAARPGRGRGAADGGTGVRQRGGT